MSFYYINAETTGKWKNKSTFPSLAKSEKKKLISRANEFLLHKCINKNKNMNFRGKFIDHPNLEKSTNPANEFLFINAETTGKWKKKCILSLPSPNPKKNLQVQPTTFSYINAETKI